MAESGRVCYQGHDMKVGVLIKLYRFTDGIFFTEQTVRKCFCNYNVVGLIQHAFFFPLQNGVVEYIEEGRLGAEACVAAQHVIAISKVKSPASANPCTLYDLWQFRCNHRTH